VRAQDSGEPNDTDALLAQVEHLESRLVQSQKLESLGRVAGGVAHDFNNILQAIMGHTTLALDRLEREGRSPAVERHLHEVLRGAERAADLTRQLLLFGRPPSGPRSVVNVSAVVCDLERLFRRVIGEDIVLQVLLDTVNAPVSCDRSQLEQVVMNLVLNARDAMPDGGRLAITVTVVGAEAPGAESVVHLVVKDNGRGMDEATLASAFEPFFTTKAPEQGTGLGLSTVYGIVRSLGGTVDITSRLGEGTTVDVRLPCDPLGERVEPGERPAPLRGGDETVLLAEDDTDVRELLAQVLTEFGYHVLSADCPRTAIEAARHGPPLDLLVSDVVMPGGTGPQLHDRLALDRPGLPVLYLTGYAERARQAGVTDADELLVKPVDPLELGRRVRALLDERASR